ncbi:MAG: SLBB domain-containing protein [Nitrospirales bacterium]
MSTAETESARGVGKRIPAVDEANDEDRSADSSVPLPNTMDGLNDTRMLGIGDRLSFKVVEDEIAPRTLVVTDSLEIDVPYIGRVPVAKNTCRQFAFYVKRQLEKEYYYRATVLVGLDAAGSATRAASRGKIYVMGQVRSPGTMEIPMDESFTVSKAILRAGGFGPYANRRKVKLIRGSKNESSEKPIIIDCAEILDKGQRSKDVELKPEDIITVPEKLINIF